MITKHSIITAARAIVRTNSGYRPPALIHPQRDWWIGLGLFACLVLVGGAILARAYMINDSLDTLQGAEASAIPRYQEEVVRDVLSLYRQRAAAYQVLRDAEAVSPLPATTTEATLIEDLPEDVTREVEVSAESAPLVDETIAE